jgi:hypothetical protein
MDNVTFETQDLRVRIEDKIARIDQRKLNGDPWQEIPLKVALLAFERENPGDTSLRIALGA